MAEPRSQAWFGEEKISPHSNDAYTSGCDHEVLGDREGAWGGW